MKNSYEQIQKNTKEAELLIDQLRASIKVHTVGDHAPEAYHPYCNGYLGSLLGAIVADLPPKARKHAMDTIRSHIKAADSK